MVVVEVTRKLLREFEAGKEIGRERACRLEFMRGSSRIVGLTFDMAAKAGEVDVEIKKAVRDSDCLSRPY